MSQTVLFQVPVNLFIHAAAIETMGTIFLCYGLAVAFGHVPAWLPMISDCAVQPPERYPFRYGTVVGALLMGATAVLVYNADKTYSKSKACLVLATLGSFCMGVVGVVNEKECNPVHSAAAVIFFFAYEANMVLQTWYSVTEPSTTWSTIILRKLLTIIVGVGLIIFVFLSLDWSKYQLYIAMLEWTATICILLYNWTYALDFYQYELAEIAEKEGQHVEKEDIPKK